MSQICVRKNNSQEYYCSGPSSEHHLFQEEGMLDRIMLMGKIKNKFLSLTSDELLNLVNHWLYVSHNRPKAIQVTPTNRVSVDFRLCTLEELQNIFSDLSSL